MPFRLVTRSRKLAGKLAGHAEQHGPRVATSAADHYRDRLPPEAELSLGTFQQFLGEDLETFEAQLRAMDDVHVKQLQTLRELREERRGWVSALREDLLQLKKTADGYWGPGADQKIFHEIPRLPEDPHALYQLGQRIYDTLTDPHFELPPSQPGVVVNPKLLAKGFAAPLQGLADVLKRLHRAESESKHTQSVKDATLEQLDLFTGRVFRLFESLYELAGHERLAKRLRLSSHARPDEGDDDGDDGDGGDGGDGDGGDSNGKTGPVFAAIVTPEPVPADGQEVSNQR